MRRALLLLLTFPCAMMAHNCSDYSDCYNMLRAALGAMVGLGVLAIALSVALDLIPIVGSIKGAIEATSGEDLVTGRRLDDWERFLGVVPIGGALLGLVGTTARWGKRVHTAADTIAVTQRPRFFGSLKTFWRDVSAKGSSAVHFSRQERTLAGSIRNVNPAKGATNCVNCAIATDATLAGHPASALLSRETSIVKLESYAEARFAPIDGESAITTAMHTSGNGSRGIVYVRKVGATIGHVFNVVNQKGVIRYLDGQTGEPFQWSSTYAEVLLLRTK